MTSILGSLFCQGGDDVICPWKIYRGCQICVPIHSVFFIRMSNFGAEAERSYVILRFEAGNVLKMF